MLLGMLRCYDDGDARLPATLSRVSIYTLPIYIYMYRYPGRKNKYIRNYELYEYSNALYMMEEDDQIFYHNELSDERTHNNNSTEMQKRRARGLPTWSPTVVLTSPDVA